ncbi:MAG: hypothetical protein OEZ33_10850 [Gammaproteobacteria bacterium]|nr:hypothetical protein [Gammaproteobacteria bacterium]MDH5778700.1 hypothetical protein [Gammaproteobacteria bacterium]
MKMNSALEKITDSLHGIMGLGLTLAAAFLVVDMLFPGTTNIVANVATLVKSFVGHGLVGLISLIVFITIFSRD